MRTGIVRLVEIIELLALENRLHPLVVDDEIGNRAAIDLMRHRDGRVFVERAATLRLLVEQDRLVGPDDLAKLRYPVAVEVDQHIFVIHLDQVAARITGESPR